MQHNIDRILENKYYILYKRIFEKNVVGVPYVIYSTDEYGSQSVEQFNYLTDAKKFFKKASQEAEQYEKELKHLTRLV